MPVERIELNDYVKREEGGQAPPARPGPLPPPPGTSGFGPIGQTLYDAFQPAPPGTDPMSFRPTDLLRELRTGFISDEDLAQIKRSPMGLDSAGAYARTAAQTAIMLSRGAGKGEHLNWRIVPGEEWNGWKEVQSPLVGQDPGKPAEVIRPAVRQDPEGNLYQFQGSHVEGDKHHVIAIPVEGTPGSIGSAITPGSPEWFQQKTVDFQKKHGFPPPEGVPFAESPFPHTQPVKVTFQDGTIHYDEIKGVDPDHALQEAWRNWPDAKNIEPINDPKAKPGTPWWEDYKPKEGWPKGDSIKPEEMKSMLSDMTGQDLGALGTGPTKQWNQLSPEIQSWFKEKYGLDSDTSAEKHWNDSLGAPKNVTDEHGQDWKVTPPPPEKPPTADQLQAELDALKADFAAGPKEGENKWDFVARIKKAQDDLKQKAQDAVTAKQEQIMKGDFSVSKEPPPDITDPTTGENLPPGHPRWEEFWRAPNKDLSWSDEAPPGVKDILGGTVPGPEGVGPVDWNWYKPQGGANPPYQPPFEVPPGWEEVGQGDMGPRSSDFWDRFNWEPPPEPPNRWDWQPPPETP